MRWIFYEGIKDAPSAAGSLAGKPGLKSGEKGRHALNLVHWGQNPARMHLRQIRA